MAKCPKCKSSLKDHTKLFGFDVSFYRCDPCKKNFSESSGGMIQQIGDVILGRKPTLEEVDDKGNRVAQKR